MVGSLVLSGGVGVSAVPVYGEPGPFSSGARALEQGYGSNMPVLIYEPSGSTASQMQFPNSPIIRIPPPPTQVTAPEWLEFAAPWLTWLLLFAALLLLMYAIRFRDRAKGLRRCPKCWYDMSATAGMKCPECGREQAHEKRFRRRRRSWRLASLAIVLLVVSYAASVAVDVYEKGWMWGVPRWALVAMAPFAETPEAQAFTYTFNQNNGGFVRGPAPTDDNLLTKLWAHLYDDRLASRPLTRLEYAVLRDDLLRRFTPGSTDWRAYAFVNSQDSWIRGDERLFEKVVNSSIVQRTMQTRAGMTEFWFAKHMLLPDRLRVQALDYSTDPPRWVTLSWHGLSPWVAVMDDGPNRRRLTVRMAHPFEVRAGNDEAWTVFDTVLHGKHFRAVKR